MISFNEHGCFEVLCNEQLIYYKVVGSWNEEASINCIDQLKQAFISCGQKPVAMIVDTQGFEGGTPQAYDLWVSAAKFWYQNNLSIFIRIDDPNTANYKLFLEKIDRLVQKTIPLKFADSLEQSIEMANKLGFVGHLSHDLAT